HCAWQEWRCWRCGDDGNDVPVLYPQVSVGIALCDRTRRILPPSTCGTLEIFSVELRNLRLWYSLGYFDSASAMVVRRGDDDCRCVLAGACPRRPIDRPPTSGVRASKRWLCRQHAWMEAGSPSLGVAPVCRPG